MFYQILVSSITFLKIYFLAQKHRTLPEISSRRTTQMARVMSVETYNKKAPIQKKNTYVMEWHEITE